MKHDACVTEDILERAKIRFRIRGIRIATHTLLGAEPVLAYFLLDQLTAISIAAGGSAAEIQRRSEEMMKAAWIAYEALRLGQMSLWDPPESLPADY